VVLISDIKYVINHRKVLLEEEIPRVLPRGWDSLGLADKRNQKIYIVT